MLLSVGVLQPLASQQRFLTIGQGGEFGATYGNDRLRLERGMPSTGTDRTVWLKLPVSGFVLTPELLSFNVELRPTRIWQDRDVFDETQRFNQLNLAYGVTVLPGRAFSLSVHGSKTNATTEGGTAGRRESNQSQFGAQLWFRFRPLPIQLSYRRQAFDDLWLPDQLTSVPFQNAMVLKSYQISASNTKVAIQAQRTIYDDLIRDLDSDNRSFNGIHTLRWGRGSQLQSTVTISDQVGVFANTRREWTERLKLYHARTVRTEYSVSRTRFETPAGAAVNRAYSAAASITAIPHVGLGMLVAGSSSQSTGSDSRSFLMAPRLGFSIGNVRTGRIAANGLVGFERRTVTGGGSEIPILDEPHDVPAGRTFTLEQPDVVVSTILIRNAASTVTYLEGSDYVVVVGARVTRIQIPLTSRINVGDHLFVSYRVLGIGSGEADGLRADVMASAEWMGFAVQHQRSFRQAPMSDALINDANDRRLEGFDDIRTRFSFRGRVPVGYLDLGAGIRDRTFGERRSKEYELNGGLTTPSIGSVTASMFGGWTSTASDEEGQRTFFLSGGLAWDLGFIRLDGSVERTVIESDQSGPQRWVIGRGSATMQAARILIEARAEILRERVPVTRSRQRVTLRLVRQF